MVAKVGRIEKDSDSERRELGETGMGEAVMCRFVFFL